MRDHKRRENFWCIHFLILVLYVPVIFCTVSTIPTYPTNENSHKTPEIEKSSTGILHSVVDRSNKGISRSDKVGNVVFSDNIPFSVGSVQHADRSNRNKRRYFSNSEIAAGLLNHRLEEPLSPDVSPSVAAAAVTTTHGFQSQNDLKIASDNTHNTAILAGNNVVRGAGVTEIGQGRSIFPGEGVLGKHGWASNSGSCLFTCSSGSFGLDHGLQTSCCQQNYVQCCPNSHNEQWNFKNLHHGRGHLLGSGIGKSGYGWGSVPYNPPPIIRPKPCLSYQHPGVIPPIVPGGSIFHKGIESIKHNIHHIGQFVKDHVGIGPGWGSGGNGAAGYYFHRRNDNDDLTENDQENNFSPKKGRIKRSVNHNYGWGNHVVPGPCSVYSIHSSYTARPYSTGLGSLIGWTKPGNQLHGGFGGGYSSIGTAHPAIYLPDKGLGWGTRYGSNFCKTDFDCSGYQKCCQGVCQIAPHAHIH